jgi:hypothetical protein
MTTSALTTYLATCLAIDDGTGGAGFAFASLTALHIKRVMNAIERAVVAPQVEIVVHRAAWGVGLLGSPAPASRAQNIHDPIHHFALVDVALVAAAPSRRHQWFDKRPFIVGQIA